MTHAFKQILAPTDFSPGSRLAIDYALELREGGELVVFENHGGNPQQRSEVIAYAKNDRLPE